MFKIIKFDKSRLKQLKNDYLILSYESISDRIKNLKKKLNKFD